MTWSRTLALVSSVAYPMEELASRFAGIRPLHGCGLQAVHHPRPLTSPWTCNAYSCPLPMELVELQCNVELKTKFYNSSPLSFFSDIAAPSRNFPKQPRPTCSRPPYNGYPMGRSQVGNNLYNSCPSWPSDNLKDGLTGKSQVKLHCACSTHRSHVANSSSPK